ncbi:hypothetical protein L9F63_026807, partial [Diploptera punctata]
FVPDTEFDAKLKINVDLTVAMPCHAIGADILDSTGQNVLRSLEQEETWFELTPKQRLYFDGMRQVNSYLREEFHAIQELLWRSGQSTLFGDMPARTETPPDPPDACRVFGSLILNKIFHLETQALALYTLWKEMKKITNQNTMLYQYFIDVVPTEVNTFIEPHQYISVF